MCGGSQESKVVVECNIDLAKTGKYAFASRKTPEYMHPRMVECASCQLVYGNPVLPKGLISAAYKDAAFDSREESAYASRTYARVVSGPLARLERYNRALDIGAGDGTFIEQLLQLGFESVSGVEPSAAPLAAAKPEIRKMIRQDVFRRGDFEEGSFDLITCFQVMEHVWDPRQLMLDVFSLLRPGGMCMTVVHDVNALSARLLGSRSPIFDIEHLQLFSSRTIRALLQKAGFKNVAAEPIWNRYPSRYWLRLAPLPTGVKERVLSLLKLTRLGEVPCSLPAGNLAAFGWRAVPEANREVLTRG